jgi:threonylcarbamoyladenosine tRNA methylthiotransferase MtaB
MENQVNEKVKAERSEIIRQISLKNEIKYYQSMLGKKQKMLIEKPKARGFATGYGENYIPLLLPADNFSRNEFREVYLEELTDTDKPAVKCKLA